MGNLFSVPHGKLKRVTPCIEPPYFKLSRLARSLAETLRVEQTLRAGMGAQIKAVRPRRGFPDLGTRTKRQDQLVIRIHQSLKAPIPELRKRKRGAPKGQE